MQQKQGYLPEAPVYLFKRAVLLALLATFIIGGCATREDVIRSIPTPDEAARNMPLRTLRVLVAYDHADDLPAIMRTITEASRVLEGQIGVVLAPMPERIAIVWGKRGYAPMLAHLEETAKQRGAPFDIAIGFARRTDSSLSCMNGSWVAVIENKYRRFIVSQETHPWFIAHEVGHAFILSKSHTDSGLMQPSIPGLAPGIYVLGTHDYVLGHDERNEALRNKWRTFGEQVDVVSEGPVPEKCTD